MADITMPQLGETVTEGTITRWFKKVGDQVAEDEPLFEVSTDKVDSEVPAAKGGYLKEILVEEGETVDVGAKLAVIDDAPPSSQRDVAPPEPETAAEPEPEPEEEDEEAEVKAVVPEGARAGAREGARAGEGRGQAGAGPRPAAEPARGGRRVLSPLVRRLLAENDLDPDDIEGTGIEGRITRNDVMTHLDKAGARSGTPKPAASRPAPAAAAPKAAAPQAPGRRGRGHPVLQHPQADGRAHGALAGHVGPRAGRHRGRLRRRRPGPPGREGRVQGRRGLLADLPAIRFPCGDRRHPRLPPRQRLGRRQRAHRAPGGPPRLCRRHQLRGPDRAGRPRRRRQAPPVDRPRAGRPRRPGAGQEAQRR